MPPTNPVTTGRRSLLKSLAAVGGLGAFASTANADGHDGFVLVQGGDCVPVEPLSGSTPVEEFYDYRTHGEQYSSHGTVDLQRPDTSLLFLYDGPKGTSLVIVHNEYGGSGDGGSASFVVSGLPTGGEWVVEDDNYGGESNYDVWDHMGPVSDIDWTWAESRTDGGVYLGVEGAEGITIDPAFNQSADLYGDYYSGTVRAWQLLTGSLESPDRVSLALDETVTIRSGTCGPAQMTRGGAGGQGRGHDIGRGEGHEKGRGRGHEKHGDDDEDDGPAARAEGDAEEADDEEDADDDDDGNGRGPPEDGEDRGRGNDRDDEEEGDDEDDD